MQVIHNNFFLKWKENSIKKNGRKNHQRIDVKVLFYLQMFKKYSWKFFLNYFLNDNKNLGIFDGKNMLIIF